MSERIELGGFGVFEDGKLTKHSTVVEEVENTDDDGTVEEETDVDCPSDEGKEDSN